MVKLRLILALLLLGPGLCADAEEYFFRQYNLDQGLNHTFIYSVDQDSSGYLWIGTGEGLYRFDGFEFEYFTTQDGLADNFSAILFTDTKGHVWIGHGNGSVSVYSDKQFLVPFKGFDSSGSVTGFSQDDQGRTWATIQNGGLIYFNGFKVDTTVLFSLANEPLSQIASLGNNYFLIGTQENLYLTEYLRSSGEMAVIEAVDGYEGSKVTGIIPGDHGFHYVVSQEYGFYQFHIDPVSLKYSLRAVDNNLNGALDNLQGGIWDDQANLWLISMGNGLIKYSLGESGEIIHVEEINTGKGMVSDMVRCVFKDSEGNLWLGMYGEGLLKYAENSLSFFQFGLTQDLNRVYALYFSDESLYAAIQDELVQIGGNADTVLNRLGLPETLPGDRVNSIYQADGGRIWLGFEQSGLYLKEPGHSTFSKVFLSNNDLANSINHIAGHDGIIWVGTKGGVCRYNSVNQDISWFTTDDGLPHNHIRHLYIDSEQRVLLATLCSEIYYLTFDGETKQVENSQMGPFTNMMSIAEGSDGSIWVGTQGNGVWRISDEENLNYTASSGLISDFCYCLVLSEDGLPMVSHRGGFSVIDPVSNRITSYNQKDGVKSSMEFYANAAVSTSRGQTWFGTSEGLIRFESGITGKREIPPNLSIKRLFVDGVEHDLIEGKIILPAAQYELVLEYIGINFTNPEMVLYQTKLEGYNKSWSDYREDRRVVYDQVGHGEYTFMIRAFNENGQTSEIDAGLVMMKIKKPIYLASWFYLTIFLLIMLGFYVILKVRERKQVRFQAFLQNKLDESTREVVMQKEEIEYKSVEITKSINYAQRIQTSIMPPLGKLEDVFSRSFILYQPKQIVSGDFYWFDDLDQDTFAVICADCTGHGVPGAFMSMIGITLIKDICSNTKLDSPSQLLDLLDKEIKSALNRNIGTSYSVDGMDMVAGFYDRKTMQFRLAGAMNPLIIYRQGVQHYVQGSRYGIGGRSDEPDKEFLTHVFDLHKGDRVYMYSDGYQDQFGGPLGKKLKTSGLKALLDGIQTLPIDKHAEILHDRFQAWKGEIEQIDDVILMGMEI